MALLARKSSALPASVEWKNHTIMVTGSRTWEDTEFVHKVLREYLDAHNEKHPGTELVLINGMADGLDRIALDFWYHDLELPVDAYPADWNKHTPGRCQCHPKGKRPADSCRVAGIIRNEKMVDEGHPDVVLAFFWEDDSAGTKHAMDYATDMGISTRKFVGQRADYVAAPIDGGGAFV